MYFSCLTCEGFFDLCFKCARSREDLHPEHEFVRLGDEQDATDGVECTVIEISPSRDRIEQIAAQDEEFQAYESSLEDSDDDDNNLLDLVERDLNEQRQSEEAATGESGTINDISNQ